MAYTSREIIEFYETFLSKKPNPYTNPELLRNEELKNSIFSYFNYKKPILKKQEYPLLFERVQKYQKLYEIITLDENYFNELKINLSLKFYLKHYFKLRISDSLRDKKAREEIQNLIKQEAKKNNWSENQSNLLYYNLESAIDKYLDYLDKKDIIIY